MKNIIILQKNDAKNTKVNYGDLMMSKLTEYLRKEGGL